MAQHEVRARIDTKVVAHKDLEIVVRRNGGKLGTLLISKGNLEWLPKGKIHQQETPELETIRHPRSRSWAIGEGETIGFL